MALKNLSTSQMLELSGAWLDPARGLGPLQAHPRASAFVVDLREAHQALAATCAPQGDPEAELTRLVQLSQEADRRHDNKGQGIFFLLQALSLLADDPRASAGYHALRDLLAPEGVGFVTMTYTEEARNTARTRSRLAARPEAAARLGKIDLPWGRTLLAEVQSWLDAGDELGRLEQRRVEAARRLEASRQAPAVGSAIEARNQWIRTVQAIEGALALRPELLGAPLVREVLAPLREAVKPAEEENIGDGSV